MPSFGRRWGRCRSSKAILTTEDTEVSNLTFFVFRQRYDLNHLLLVVNDVDVISVLSSRITLSKCFCASATVYVFVVMPLCLCLLFDLVPVQQLVMSRLRRVAELGVFAGRTLGANRLEIDGGEDHVLRLSAAGSSFLEQGYCGLAAARASKHVDVQVRHSCCLSPVDVTSICLARGKSATELFLHFPMQKLTNRANPLILWDLLSRMDIGGHACGHVLAHPSGVNPSVETILDWHTCH
jgi:hypothetical protein